MVKQATSSIIHGSKKTNYGSWIAIQFISFLPTFCHSRWFWNVNLEVCFDGRVFEFLVLAIWDRDCDFLYRLWCVISLLVFFIFATKQPWLAEWWEKDYLAILFSHYWCFSFLIDHLLRYSRREAVFFWNSFFSQKSSLIFFVKQRIKSQSAFYGIFAWKWWEALLKTLVFVTLTLLITNQMTS